MDMNTFVQNLTWKKIAIGAISVLLMAWVLHEILFFAFFHETKQMLDQFNKQFTQQQTEIHKTISESEEKFADRDKAFDEMSKKFGEFVERQQKETFDYLTKVEKEQEERQKEFNKAFNEAPQKMWEAHEKFGEEMRKNFIKESKKMDEDFFRDGKNPKKNVKE